MRKKIVAGNWKMHGSLQSNQALMTELIQLASFNQSVEVVIFPPFIYIPQIQSLTQDTLIKVGAQNSARHLSGAFTGEVSASMLADLNVNYVLVGHSERRSLFKETEVKFYEQIKLALSKGLKVMLCVGETLQEREAGITEEVIDAQLMTLLSVPLKEWKNLVIAYEPVWAIGTGLTATPEQAQKVHAFIRQRLSHFDQEKAEAMSILYGGSVKASSAAGLFAMSDIDGALVGGASLDAKEFAAIIAAAYERLEN